MLEGVTKRDAAQVGALLEPARLAALAGVGSQQGVQEGVWPPGSGVSFHSGRVQPGDVFFALPGQAAHGIAFAGAALAAGAAFMVSDRPHPRGLLVPDPAGLLLRLGREARACLTGPVVGITGSAGKTSTKAMVAAALGAPSSPGNFNTPLALAQVLVGAALRGRSEEALVLELGIDHSGEMDALLTLVKPTHALLTLIGASHLSGLGSVAEVAREKGKLLRAAPVRLAHASTRRQLKGVTEVRFYGLDDEAGDLDFSGRILAATAERQELEVFGRRVALPYPGRPMAANAVAAMSLARLLERDLDAAAARLAVLRLEPGRLEVRHCQGFTLIDDAYNSNPASARAALEVLAAFPRPHSAILGDMLELGARSAGLHRALGAATRGLDRLYTVGAAAHGIGAGREHARHFSTVESLIEALARETLTGTVLVKASRGMRLERVVRELTRQGERA
ncbi:MAG: UDP-N-acetylmuramoyl-tripeptide--D-alanyl-D-alanine ligase [Deinococcota bacterium]|nr:UDP-N-acetylmuramoyl-tripeptide--D-alanyl-D-alanine ligase [Deinococcota bacterium]